MSAIVPSNRFVTFQCESFGTVEGAYSKINIVPKYALRNHLKIRMDEIITRLSPAYRRQARYFKNKELMHSIRMDNN